jgi:hypothetical protein
VCPLLAFRLQKLQVPGLYDNIGHAPFWEDTARFNAELAAFLRQPTRPIDARLLSRSERTKPISRAVKVMARWRIGD